MRPSLIFFIVFSMLASLGCQQPQDPANVVVVSIKPVQLVLQPLTADIIDTVLLDPDSHTPHQVTLGFRQQRLLRDASALVWMGPAFEPYLARALPAQLPDWSLPAAGANDHFWLDPMRLREVMPELVAFIASIKPQSADDLQNRLQQQQDMLRRLDSHISDKLAVLAGTRVFSGHGGVTALLARHNINVVASLDSAAHSGISLQKAREYRAMVQRGEIACLLLEHPERETKLRAMFEGLPLRIIELDLLAHEASNYPQYMTLLTDKLLNCQP